MKFQLRLSSTRKGVQVVEVRDDNGDLLATITPGDTSREIRLMSKHLLQSDQMRIQCGDGVIPTMVRFYL